MIKNIISAFFTRGLVAFINLAVLLISSKQLGAEVTGQIVILILNITIIQIVNEVYTGYSLVHFIAKFPAKKIYVTGLLWTLCCIAVLNLIFYFFNIGIKNLWMHTLVLSFMGTLGSFNCVVLLAKQKIKTYNLLVFFQPAVLLLALCFYVFIMADKTVHGYIAAMYISFALTLVVSGVFVIRLLKTETNFTEAKQPVFKLIVENGFINQAGNLAHTLSNRINFYLIAGVSLIGVYSRASSLIESVWLVSSSITPIVLTRVANHANDSESSRITFLLSKISLVLSIVCVLVVLCVPGSFFIFLLGNDFAGIKTLMLYLSPGILCIGFSTVISHYFSGAGEQKVQLLANCLGLLVTVCTAPFLISRYQLAGACYSASLSYFMQALVVTAIFMKRKDLKFTGLFSFRKDLELLRR